MKKIRFCFLFVSALVLLARAFPLFASAQGVPGVSAQSAVMISADSGEILYDKESDTKLSMASTTKIMTALLALEYVVEFGNETVEITEEMVLVEGSSMGLQAGDGITLTELVTGMLLASGNDAANAVAVYISGSCEAFAEKMNSRAREIGMKNTNFVTPSGLDAQEHYSTAYDMALLAREALKNREFARIAALQNGTVKFEHPDKTVEFTNHNKLLWLYDGCIGIKTGFTKKSGRCLVSAAQRDGTVLIAVTLNAPDDWDDHEALYDYGFSNWKTYYFEMEDFSYKVPCVGGERAYIGLSCGEAGSVTLSAEQADKISVDIFLPRFVYAPVKAGDRIGEVAYYLEDKKIFSLGIFSQSTLGYKEKEKKGLFESLFGWSR